MSKIAERRSLKVQHLKTGYDKKVIIEDLTLELPEHKISIFIGPNGCGKSTLLKTLARLIDPMDGERLLDGKDYRSYNSKELARIIGLLPQSPIVPEGIKVSDLVARGRYPYQEAFKSMAKEDFEIIDEAMEMMGVMEFADTNVEDLSGGQRQRVWIAMALAQQTDILLLDEPTTYLDISYQIEILNLLKKLNEERKITIAMVLHDMNLSARYADYMFAIKDGRLVDEGRPCDIMSAELLKKVFNLDCIIIDDPISHTPMMVPGVDASQPKAKP